MVSLIVTSYNCRENIRGTLKSIELQDYDEIEVVIVDGGSTDGTVDVIKQFAESTQYKCQWISEKDAGLYDALNKGIKLSTGDIVAIFNDLFLVPNAVSLMVEAMEREKSDGVHADLIYADEENRIKRYWKMGEGTLRQGWLPGHPTLYLRRAVYDRYGFYDTSYKCSADYEFMIRILKDDEVKLAYVPVTIIRMYYGGTSTGGVGSYWVSMKEGHRALKVNGIKRAFWIDLRRTVKVFMQFVNSRQYKGAIE